MSAEDGQPVWLAVVGKACELLKVETLEVRPTGQTLRSQDIIVELSWPSPGPLATLEVKRPPKHTRDRPIVVPRAQGVLRTGRATTGDPAVDAIAVIYGGGLQVLSRFSEEVRSLLSTLVVSGASVRPGAVSWPPSACAQWTEPGEVILAVDAARRLLKSKWDAAVDFEFAAEALLSSDPQLRERAKAGFAELDIDSPHALMAAEVCFKDEPSLDTALALVEASAGAREEPWAWLAALAPREETEAALQSFGAVEALDSMLTFTGEWSDRYIEAILDGCSKEQRAQELLRLLSPPASRDERCERLEALVERAELDSTLSSLLLLGDANSGNWSLLVSRLGQTAMPEKFLEVLGSLPKPVELSSIDRERLEEVAQSPHLRRDVRAWVWNCLLGFEPVETAVERFRVPTEALLQAVADGVDSGEVESFEALLRNEPDTLFGIYLRVLPRIAKPKRLVAQMGQIKRQQALSAEVGSVLVDLLAGGKAVSADLGEAHVTDQLWEWLLGHTDEQLTLSLAGRLREQFLERVSWLSLQVLEANRWPLGPLVATSLVALDSTRLRQAVGNIRRYANELNNVSPEVLDAMSADLVIALREADSSDAKATILEALGAVGMPSALSAIEEAASGVFVGRDLRNAGTNASEAIVGRHSAVLGSLALVEEESAGGLAYPSRDGALSSPERD